MHVGAGVADLFVSFVTAFNFCDYSASIRGVRVRGLGACSRRCFRGLHSFGGDSRRVDCTCCRN